MALFDVLYQEAWVVAATGTLAPFAVKPYELLLHVLGVGKSPSPSDPLAEESQPEYKEPSDDENVATSHWIVLAWAFTAARRLL